MSRVRPRIATTVAVGLSALALSVVTACGTPTTQTARQEAPTQAPVASPAAPSSAPSSSASTGSAPSSSAASSGAPSSSASSSAPAPSTSSPAAPTTTAPPKPPALMASGATGEQVRDLQVRLRQIGWFAGTITGQFADTTVEAVRGFQAKRGLTETGEVDQTTWDRLAGMTTAPTHDEKHNILRPGPALMKTGQTSDKIKQVQARLAQIDWFSDKVTGYYGPATVAAVKGFQGKRGYPVTGEVDQRTLDGLTAMTRQPTKVELGEEKPKAESGKGTKASKLDKRCRTGRVICISKTTNKVSWVIDGDVKLTMDARFGREGMETREGTFQVGWKSRNHTSTIYHTWMPYAMFFSGGQAVHYSPDFAANGYNGGSHGCVNIRDKGGVAWLFDQVRVGDKVVVYW